MKERQDSLQQAKTREFDLVVIGAGLTGASVAAGAASCGLSVLLLEKGDFTSGFSSKGLQFVHGDLCYLKQMRIKLARALTGERERLKRQAPHLVKECSFIMPLIKTNTIFNLKATLGLWLYDMWSLSSGQGNKHSFLSRKKLTNLAPALSSESIWGGIEFEDAITDDARLVLALIKTAAAHGATVLNYVQAFALRGAAGSITGVNCHDRYSSDEFIVSAKLCVTAGGVWTDQLLNTLCSSQKSHVKPLKSTQIVVPCSAFETNCALLLPDSRGRFVYVLPWHHALLVGAAENPYSGDLDQPRSSQEEIAYLLSVVNTYTEHQELDFGDVKASFSGLRADVCVQSETTSPDSQEYAIFETAPDLFSVVGAKLNNYRLMAQELMDKLSARHAWLNKGGAAPAAAMLGGWSGKQEFLQKSTAIETRARGQSIDPAAIEHLISSYGSESEHVVDLVERQPALNQRIIADYPVIMAEVPFAVAHEMTVSLQDFFLRRTRLGLLNHKAALAAAPRVAHLMGQILAWDEYRLQMELSALKQELLGFENEPDAASQ